MQRYVMKKAAELNSLLYNAKYSLAEIALIYKNRRSRKILLQAIEDEELAQTAIMNYQNLNDKRR